jgi:hypothetical protein
MAANVNAAHKGNVTYKAFLHTLSHTIKGAFHAKGGFHLGAGNWSSGGARGRARFGKIIGKAVAKTEMKNAPTFYALVAQYTR